MTWISSFIPSNKSSITRQSNAYNKNVTCDVINQLWLRNANFQRKISSRLCFTACKYTGRKRTKRNWKMEKKNSTDDFRPTNRKNGRGIKHNDPLLSNALTRKAIYLFVYSRGCFFFFDFQIIAQFFSPKRTKGRAYLKCENR